MITGLFHPLFVMEAVLAVVLVLCFQAQAQHFQYFYSNPVRSLPQFAWQQPQAYTPQFTQRARFHEAEDLYQSQVPAQLPADNYRGYTYHTSFNDGASSTVVFFRGPPVPAQANFIQNSRLNTQTLASDNVDPKASRNDIEDNIAVAMNGQNQKNGAFFRSPLSLIANMLEHPGQQNTILHFFDQVPASTFRLQQPSMQTSESVINQYLPANYPEHKAKKEQLPGHRQDKSLDDTVVIGARLSEMISEAPQTSTTSAPQTTASSVDFTTSQGSIINETTEATNPSSSIDTKTTTESLSDTTTVRSTEETSTIALSKDTQTMKPEAPHNENTSDQSSTTIPDVSITKNIGSMDSAPTNETSKDTESTTTDKSDLENTTKMIIIVA